MLPKYKLIVLALVIALAATVLILTNQNLLSSGEAEPDQITADDSNAELEEKVGLDDEFKPAADPYQAYLDARDAGKPVVLEFYARW